MKLNNKEKFINFVLILVIILFLIMVYVIALNNNENNNLELISKPHIQNKDQTSYFLSLEPDNLGNFKIELDVINYNKNSSRIFSIIQEDIPKKDGKYKEFNPNLVYLFYSNKIYSISSNKDQGYHVSGKIGATISENGFEETRILEQKIAMLLPNIANNITDFSLLIFVKDENSKSTLSYYPLDSIKSVITFDFPNESNVNFLMKIPPELKSYSVKPSVLIKDKQTGETKSYHFKEIFSGTYEISSTNSINHDKNYAKIEIEIKRYLSSIEIVSFISIILITSRILLHFFGRKSDYIHLYSVLFSIAFAFYIINRPHIGITVFESAFVLIVLVTVLFKNYLNKQIISH